MPDESSRNYDATTPDAGGPSDAAVDALVMAIPHLDCTEFTPEVFGLTTETAQNVQLVLSGKECRPIYLSPRVTEECGDQEIFPVNSKIQFEGTLLVMEKPAGFTLQEGQLLYTAVQGACTRFPEAEVRAIGFKFKPMGLSDAEIQLRIENGTYGELLARVHIWKGEGKVETIEGEEIISLLAGQQALISQDGTVQERIDFTPPGNGQSADPGSKKKVSVPPGDKGCNTTPALPGGLDPVMSAILLLLLGRNLQGKIKELLK